jgi:hypothetical protein
MKKINMEQWGAATGYLSIAIGIAAMSFERGAPAANAGPEKAIAYIRKFQGELLAQSLLFVIGICVSICFYTSLRSFLRRAEGEAGSLSSLAFASGCLSAGLQMTFQSMQIGMAMIVDFDPSTAAALGLLGYAVSVVAYAPYALMLAAVAVLSFRRKAFPSWLGVVSAIAAAANFIMLFGIVAKDGILTPGAPLTYAAYALYPIWLLSATTLMIRGLGKREANFKAPA